MIVVGTGLSGLVAHELAAANRSVIMLDAEPLGSVGGQAYWSLGGLFMVNSPEQRRLRIHDSEELALADWLGSAAFDRLEDYWPRRWAEAYVHFAAGEQRRWLRDLGVRWFCSCNGPNEAVTPLRDTGIQCRVFTSPGALALRCLSRLPATLHSHRVRIRSRHQVTSMQVDGSGVRVSGLVLEPTDLPCVRDTRTAITEFTLTAQAAVVASGGIRKLRPRQAELARRVAHRRNACSPACLIMLTARCSRSPRLQVVG